MGWMGRSTQALSLIPFLSSPNNLYFSYETAPDFWNYFGRENVSLITKEIQRSFTFRFARILSVFTVCSKKSPIKAYSIPGMDI